MIIQTQLKKQLEQIISVLDSSFKFALISLLIIIFRPEKVLFFKELFIV